MNERSLAELVRGPENSAARELSDGIVAVFRTQTWVWFGRWLAEVFRLPFLIVDIIVGAIALFATGLELVVPESGRALAQATANISLLIFLALVLCQVVRAPLLLAKRAKAEPLPPRFLVEASPQCSMSASDMPCPVFLTVQYRGDTVAHRCSARLVPNLVDIENVGAIRVGLVSGEIIRFKWAATEAASDFIDMQPGIDYRLNIGNLTVIPERAGQVRGLAGTISFAPAAHDKEREQWLGLGGVYERDLRVALSAQSPVHTTTFRLRIRAEADTDAAAGRLGRLVTQVAITPDGAPMRDLEDVSVLLRSQPQSPN